MKKRTKRIIIVAVAAVVCIALAATLWLIGVVLVFSPGDRLAREQTLTLESHNGKFTLVEDHRRTDGVMTAYISILENGKALYGCPDSYRTWDYHGTFWGLDSYDFWTLSSDIGMCCYVYDEGVWRKGWRINYGTDAWAVTIDGTTETKTIPVAAVPPEVTAYRERIEAMMQGGLP